MITVVGRGNRMRGLLEYLFGPGRFEEHRNQRIVAAWDQTLLGSRMTDKHERGLLADEMDAPRRLFGTDVAKGYVYHVPIALHVDDGRLTDTQWREIAEEAIRRLGFDEGPGRAGCRWIAVHHGPAADGRDHIHLAVSLVREDGSVASRSNDFLTLSQFRADMERRYNLTRRTRSRGAGMPGLRSGELRRAARDGQPEPDRIRLARVVRAAAAAARDESDFLRRARKAGVILRPRWAKGSRTQVVGYSAALRPSAPGGRLIWYGGRRLAPDLGLPELRRRWLEPDAEQRLDLVREWRPPGWRRLPTSASQQAARLRAEAWKQAGQVVDQVRQQLARLDPADHVAWTVAARAAAGNLAALAARVEPDRRAELSRAADALSRVAQLERGSRRPPRMPTTSPLAGVARVAMDAALASRGGAMAVTALVMQLGRLVQQIQRAHEATRREIEARQAATAAQEMLAYVRRAPAPHHMPQERHSERDQGAAPRTVTALRERGRDDRTERGR
ncbi:mobilization protein [Longimycelium tulufanense]|uniref:Mobilization protein n=1 Tax=Longimycelium tulufanense TaxID=907463 RepID=A0A8J3CK52_9PSEU|nr:hypothetical protein [Longimycelium tulufanense]GGM81947.1 mobilization protein [Longimycelium tulufanense]